jgi:hypothetical protein
MKIKKIKYNNKNYQNDWLQQGYDVWKRNTRAVLSVQADKKVEAVV